MEPLTPLIFLYRGMIIQLCIVIPVGVWWLYGIKDCLIYLGQQESLSQMTEVGSRLNEFSQCCCLHLNNIVECRSFRLFVPPELPTNISAGTLDVFHPYHSDRYVNRVIAKLMRQIFNFYVSLSLH